MTNAAEPTLHRPQGHAVWHCLAAAQPTHDQAQEAAQLPKQSEARLQRPLQALLSCLATAATCCRFQQNMCCLTVISVAWIVVAALAAAAAAASSIACCCCCCCCCLF
jgi:hypothetical protein